jgi:hypothetical protein
VLAFFTHWSPRDWFLNAGRGRDNYYTPARTTRTDLARPANSLHDRIKVWREWGARHGLFSGDAIGP